MWEKKREKHYVKLKVEKEIKFFNILAAKGYAKLKTIKMCHKKQRELMVFWQWVHYNTFVP